MDGGVTAFAYFACRWGVTVIGYWPGLHVANAACITTTEFAKEGYMFLKVLSVCMSENGSSGCLLPGQGTEFSSLIKFLLPAACIQSRSEKDGFI